MANDDTLTKLLNLIGGVSQGVQYDPSNGSTHMSISNIARGVGGAMQDNKNQELQRKAAEQQLEIQKWQFDQEKKRAKANDELEAMQLSQQKTQHEAFRATSQEQFNKFNQEQLKEVISGKRRPEDMQFMGDRFKVTRDAEGNIVKTKDKNLEMLEKIRAGGLSTVESTEQFNQTETFRQPASAKAAFKVGGPAGMMSGFIFKAFNPFTQRTESRVARVLPDPTDGSILTDGVSLDYLENLRDLSIAQPDRFDQYAQDKIRNALYARKRLDIKTSEENDAINGIALAKGLVTDDDVIADSQFNKVIAKALPVDLSIARLDIKKAITNGNLGGVWSAVNNLYNGFARSQFRQTQDWTTLQKSDIEARQALTPLPGMGLPKSVKLTNKSLAERRKYGVAKNAPKRTK